MKVDWDKFFANGGFSNENSDPASYAIYPDDDFDEEDFNVDCYDYDDYTD